LKFENPKKKVSRRSPANKEDQKIDSYLLFSSSPSKASGDIVIKFVNEYNTQNDFCFLNYSRTKKSKNLKLLDFVGIAILLKIQKVLINCRYPI